MGLRIHWLHPLFLKIGKTSNTDKWGYNLDKARMENTVVLHVAAYKQI